MDRTLSATAEHPKLGMSLDELITFAETAKADGVPGETVPTVATTTWGLGIKRIQVDTEADAKRRRRAGLTDG